MPENAEQFNILDKLESVLEFSGKAEVRVNGKKVGAQITQDNGELNVEFKGDFVKQNGGKSIDIEFKAKITKDADLSRYEDLGYAVPNEARYIVNNNPKITGKTPPVFVTPPPTKIVPPKPGKKSINSENGEENETLRELKVNNEVFRYDIKERLGINQDYKQFAISDDLEKVLDILKAEIRIDGEKIDTIAVDKELAKLNDELAKSINECKEKTLSINANSELATVSKDESNLEVRLLGKKQQLETVKAKLKSEKTKEKVVELNKEQALLEKDIAILTGKLSEKQNTAKNTSVDKEKLEKAVHDLQKQIKDYKEYKIGIDALTIAVNPNNRPVNPLNNRTHQRPLQSRSPRPPSRPGRRCEARPGIRIEERRTLGHVSLSPHSSHPVHGRDRPQGPARLSRRRRARGTGRLAAGRGPPPQ